MIFYKENEFKETSIGKIPMEWECRSLEEVVASCENGVWGDEPSSINNSYPVIRSTEITHDGKIDLSSVAYREIPEETVEKYALENGDILVVGSSGSARLIGRTALFSNPNNRKYLFSNFMIRIRPQNIHPHFLYYYLNSKEYFLFLRRLQQTSTGLRNLRKKEFLKLNVPFPPLPEQRAVVGVLGVVDSAVELVDKVIAKTERLKKGLMQMLLTRGIGHKEYKQTPIGKIPKTWKVVKLGEVLIDVKYGTSVKSNKDGIGVPILGIPNILRGEIGKSNLRYVKLSKKEQESLTLKSGDILLVRTNANPEYIGRCALFKEKKGTWVYASYLIRIRVDEEKVTPEYLVKYLQSEKARKQFLSITRTSAGNYNINTKGIKWITVCLPPIPEQHKIANILLTIDKKLKLERNKKAKLERIKKGFMDLLLTGKVRVKVN